MPNRDFRHCNVTREVNFTVLFIKIHLPQLIFIVRGKYQGIIGGLISVGFAIGPIAGGALAQKVSWRVRSYILFPDYSLYLSFII